MAVEKIFPTKFAKIKLRQEALQSMFSGRLDIFYPSNFGGLGRKASFSTTTLVFASSLYNKHGYARSEHCQCRDRHDDPSQAGTRLVLHQFLVRSDD